MRYAVLIIGLLLTVGLFLQSLTGSALSSLGEDEDLQAAAAVGVWMSFLWLIACGFVIPKPRFSAVLFLVSAPFGALGWSDFPDLQFWSGVAILLSVMSYFGFRGKRKEEAKTQERDDLMRQLVAYQAAEAGMKVIGTGSVRDAVFTTRESETESAPAALPNQTPCPTCGTVNTATSRFCSECGQRLEAIRA